MAFREFVNCNIPPTLLVCKRMRPVFPIFILATGFNFNFAPGQQNQPAAEAKPNPARPEFFIQAAQQAVLKNRPDFILYALPKSYRVELEETVQMIGKSVDEDLFKTTMGLVTRVATILEDKRELIVNSRLYKKQNPNENATLMYDKGTQALSIFGHGQLAKLENWRKFSLANWLRNDGKRVLGLFTSIHPDDPNAARLREFTQTLLTLKPVTTGTRGKLAMVQFGDQKIAMTRIEGRWVPFEFAEGFEKFLSDTRAGAARLRENRGEMQKLSALVNLFSSSLYATLDKVEVAKTEEDLVRALEGAALLRQFIPK